MTPSSFGGGETAAKFYGCFHWQNNNYYLQKEEGGGTPVAVTVT